MSFYDTYAEDLKSREREQGAIAQRTFYDEFAQSLDREREQRLAVSVGAAVKVNPEKAAQAKQISDAMGFPLPAVEERFDEAAQRKAARDLQMSLSTSPILRRQFMDPTFAKIAQDQTKELGLIEETLRFAKDAGLATVAGFGPRFAGNLWGIPRIAGELASKYLGGVLPVDFGKAIADYSAKRAKDMSGFASDIRRNEPQGQGFVRQSVMGGFESLGANLLTLPLGFLGPGGVNASLTAMGASTGGEGFNKALDQKVDPLRALGFGVSQGLVEVATELMPVKMLFGDLNAATPFLKLLGKQVLYEMPGEQVATLLQDLNEWAVLHPDKPFSAYLKERPSAALQTLIATAVGVGGQTTIMKGIDTALNGAERARQRADQAELRAQYLDSLNAAVGATKVLQRDANSLQAFIQEAATDGPVENLYVPAAVFAQAAGENLELLKQQVPAVAEQIDAALATGGDLVIPVGELVALQGTGMEKVLIDNARTTDDPGDMSREDAKVFLQQEGKRFEEAAARMVEKATEDAAQTASRQAVEADLMKQFAGVGRFSQEVAAFNSKLAGAMFETMGRKTGKTAEQVYREFALGLQSTPIDKKSFDQDPTSTPQFKEWFGDSKVVDAEGRPLVVYRGTNADITVFDPSMTYDGGLYFTSNPSHAVEYAEIKGTRRPITMPVYLSIKKPLIIDAAVDSLGPQFNADWQQRFESEIIDAQASGEYDGIHVKNMDALGHGPDSDIYIAFRPEQIKSATDNTGAFDPNNPNIYEQRAPRELPQGTPIPDTVAAAGTLRAVLPLAGERQWKTNREFKLAIQERVRAAADAAGVDLDNDSVELREFLYKVLLDESRSAIEGDSTAIGWYDEKVTVAIEVLSVIHPELKTDPIAKFHFTLALAITSNGIKVDRNFVMAEGAYEQKKRTGSFPYNKGEGTAAAQINKTFRYVDRLLERFGDQQLEELFTSEKTVREWEQIFGKKVSGEGMDETAFGAAMMGPKIGNGFFMNLHGRFGQLTMDRWFVRLWKRLTGGLVIIDQDLIKKNRNGLEAVIRALQLPENKEAREALEKELNSEKKKKKKNAKAAPEKQTKLRITLKDRDLLAKRVIAKTSDGARRDRMKAAGALSPEAEETLRKIAPRKGAEKNYGTLGNALRLLSKSYISAVDGQVESPTQPERPMMRAVMRRVLAELQKTWEHLTMADLQAVVWYPEKRLYEKAGIDEAKEKAEQAEADEEDYSEDQAPDYANAAVKLARLKGIKDEDINAAVAEGRRLVAERNRARATRAVDGVGSGGSLFGQGGAVQPATLADSVNPIAPAGPEVFTKGGIGSLLRRGDWAILTAENPEGVQLPEAENAARLDAMRQQLTQMGLQFVDVLGSYGGNPEHSIAITGITEDQALALARQFGQQSVLTRKGLVYRDGAINPSKGLTVHAKAPADFYTTLPDGTTFTVDLDLDNKFPAQEGRVGEMTVGAAHFSREVRTILDPNKYGTGMKGAENPAADVRARTHWYVNNGQGVMPESGVGAFAHVARLTNLYDADADPLGVWKAGGESAVKAAGFDGYVTRKFGNQGVAVAFDIQVPVTYVGGTVQANEMLAGERLPEPQYTAKRALANEIMADTRLPMGQIERARWKAILDRADPRYAEALPASAFEGDERVYRDELVRALFNQDPGVTRGNISFGDDITKTPSVISLLKDANLSTFHHELGHFYLEMLTHIARQPGAPQDVIDDVARIMKWFGVRDLVEWDSMDTEARRPFHEQFARGYEAYLFEGKAPSIELRGVMATVRGWMINIYKQITSLGVTLTDEVRGVYDRMLASEEQIKAASEEQALMPFFKSAEEMGATPEEWLQYQRLAADAQEDALRSFEARSLRDMQWLTNARGRLLRKMQREVAEKRAVIEEEVTKEVEQQPVYAARKWLAYGILPTGEQTVGAKLDVDAMREMYGDSPAAIWRYLPTGEKGLAGKEGMHPDQVAEMFGFSSGDALVRALVAADKQQDVVEGLTDQRMLERYGDLQSPAGVERAVNEALHSELRAKMIATELAALQAAQPREDTGRTATDSRGRARKITLAILPRAARAFAERLLAQKRIHDIKPNRYIAAEVRAAKAAERASKVEEKIIEKRNQLINHYAAKLGFEALDEIEKSLRYLRKFEEEGTRKNLASDYVDQIDQLLEKVELRRVSEETLRKRASLAEWMAQQEALGLDPVVDQALVDATGLVNYRTMTLEEFRGLVDSVKSIEHLGRLKQKLLTAKDEREFAAVVEEMRASAEANANREAKVRIEQGRGLDRGLKMGRQVTAMHRKFASLIREIDGGEDGGSWWERLVRPMNASGDKEVAMRADATMAFAALAKQHLKATKLTRREEVLPGISLSREGMISMALNWGNEGNRQRLLDGGFTGAPITQAQAEAVLARLTDAEWNFVEGVWKMLDQYRPRIAEQEKRLTGVEPKWIEPSPFTLPSGRTIAGGYYPAKYDVDLSTRSNELEAITDLRQQMRGAAGRASTRKGYTEKRATEVKNRPLRKDFGVIVQHLAEVTHRLAWQDWIVDARRLIGANALDGVIREKYGPEILTELRKQIEELAAGDVGATTAFEGVMAHLRKGVSIAGMGWNVTTALIQPLGYTQSMVRIGTKWAAVGLGKFVANPSAAWQEAKAKSSFMETRALTINRDLTDILNRIDSKELSNLEASYFWLIQKMQMAVDVPTWHGAYERALAEGNDEKRAIALADQAVIDAQGAGHLKDQARIQRGSEAAKLFTSFYNFFNTTYNLAVERGRTAGVRGERAKLFSDYALLFVIPVMGSVLLKALLKGEDDDPEKLLKKYAAEQISYLLGTSLITRELGGAVSGAIGGFPYSGPASMRVFVEAGKLAVQAGQGEADKAALKAANNVGGILLHYPAGQVQRTVEGIYEMNQGPQPITAPIFGPVRN